MSETQEKYVSRPMSLDDFPFISSETDPPPTAEETMPEGLGIPGRPVLCVDFSSYPSLWVHLRKIAFLEHRSPEMQVLHLIDGA